MRIRTRPRTIAAAALLLVSAPGLAMAAPPQRPSRPSVGLRPAKQATSFQRTAKAAATLAASQTRWELRSANTAGRPDVVIAGAPADAPAAAAGPAGRAAAAPGGPRTAPARPAGVAAPAPAPAPAPGSPPAASPPTAPPATAAPTTTTGRGVLPPVEDVVSSVVSTLLP